MFKKRKIVLLVLSFWLILACNEDKAKHELEDEFPKMRLEDFSLTETKQGQKLWILNADKARVFDKIIIVDSVKIQFFNREEVEFSVLTAPGGILNQKTHDVLVGDSVVVVTDDSTKLYTDSLFWRNDSEQIITNQPVKIYQQDSTVIEGTGLRADPYLEKIEILGTATGVTPIELPDIRK